MKYALAAALVMLGLNAEAKMSGGEFKYSEWDAWNSFKEGSSVTIDMEASGMKMKTTTTLKKKEAEVLTVESVTEMSGNKLPGQERKITKPKEGATDQNCKKCGKPAKDHVKWTEAKEKVKVGDKELECTKIDAKMNDCDGKEQGTSVSWYSNDVPGGIVKMEATYGGSTTKMACSAFDAKK
jgi:hypothetical protein